ncbi:MAG TPA: hypothetical protein DDX93_03315 [Smithella sp.]|nr:hypothetical protein [Smithella sp.]
MKQTSKVLSVSLTTLFIIVAFSSVSLAGNKPPVASPTTSITVVKQPVPNLDICKDPAVSNFNVTKTLSNGIATFTMTGQVCNNGPGDWNKPDDALEAHFDALAAYAPQFSYAAAGDVKYFTQTVGPVLKKNQCLTFTQKFTRDKVLQWGFAPPTAAIPANSRQMRLMFEFYVRDAQSKMGRADQPKSLDCNANNNILSQTFEMTISTQ